MTDLKLYERIVWLNDVEVQTPVIFDLDEDVIFSVSKPSHINERFSFRLSNQRRRILATDSVDDEYTKKAVRTISEHWGLKEFVFPNGNRISYELSWNGTTYGGQSAYLIKEVDIELDLLICFGYEGDEGRSQMIGLIYKISTVQSNEELRRIFYS